MGNVIRVDSGSGSGQWNRSHNKNPAVDLTLATANSQQQSRSLSSPAPAPEPEPEPPSGQDSDKLPGQSEPSPSCTLACTNTPVHHDEQPEMHPAPPFIPSEVTSPIDASGHWSQPGFGHRLAASSGRGKNEPRHSALVRVSVGSDRDTVVGEQGRWICSRGRTVPKSCFGRSSDFLVLGACAFSSFDLCVRMIHCACVRTCVCLCLLGVHSCKRK